MHSTLRSHYVCLRMMLDGRGSSTLIFRNIKKYDSRKFVKGDCFAPHLFSFKRGLQVVLEAHDIPRAHNRYLLQDRF